jgi:hypothetical protein
MNQARRQGFCPQMNADGRRCRIFEQEETEETELRFGIGILCSLCLLLGTWQQIFHLECDIKPRRRTIAVTVMGDA